jgi:D-arginine dehydrogenase
MIKNTSRQQALRELGDFLFSEPDPCFRRFRRQRSRSTTGDLRRPRTMPKLRIMDTYEIDIAVIGAGIAGTSAAAALAATHRVALIEAEEAAGYHSTGRSAAVWILNYGPHDVRLLTGLSRPFFENPPEGFTETPLMSRRPVVFLAPEDQVAALKAMLDEGIGLRPADVTELRRRVPALRPDYAVAAAIEEDAFDMDVAALHQGFLRQLRARGGALALRSRAGRIERNAGKWHVHASGGAVFCAGVLVNAAGAWGDEVARIAGVAPLGLTPCRRTGVIIDPAPYEVADWPLINDVGHTWYTRPEARTRLMVSPADETPMHPHDVQPDELDIAIAIDRMQQALDIPVQRVERSWAGLRTFTPDRSLAFGWDPDADGFFWCVGQGGYGIQTSPVAGSLVANLVTRREPGAAASILAAIDPARFR